MITPPEEAGTAGAGLSAGRGSPLPLLIVGGGIAGCSLAWELARRGLEPTLLERGRIGRQGASAVGAALLNPYRGRSAKPGRYDLPGLAAFWRMVAALKEAGRDHGAQQTGVLRVASNERQARSWAQLAGLTAQNPPPPPYRAPHGAFLVESGGWVQPSRLLGALAADAERAGASFEEECAVEAVERRQGLWSVHTASGVRRARKVVLCLGAGSVEGVSLPQVERIAGDQVTLASDAPLPYPLAGAVYLASTGGQVLVGGNHREPERADPQAPLLLRASAARMVPALGQADIERVWTGVRAKRSDNLPLQHELEPGLWYLGAFGGRGFLTAPLLAAQLAAELTAN